MERNVKLLLVEDERMLAEILSDTLRDHDFEVCCASDGVEALACVQREAFDVIVTDVMMPRMDGFTLVKRLRSEGITAPVLFLTARSATEDVVKGFETGGNDFLRKPFAIDELIVRIRALAGRVRPSERIADELQLGQYRFDTRTNTLTIDARKVTLSAREGAVLARLGNRLDQTVEASGLLRELWGDDNFFNLRSLNVYISRLRRHLADDPSIEIISIRGVGYRLRIR